MAKALGQAEPRSRNGSRHCTNANPMLGHRGCRLSVTYPEILEMQVTAIVEAAINCKKKKIDAKPEIMIPLVGTKAELETLREKAIETIAAVKKAKKYTGKLDIPVGTMIEIPRAALTADEVAECADFFSFGTNDLTQMTFGYSRDDVNTFLPDYLAQESCRPIRSSRWTRRAWPVGRDGRREGPIDQEGPEAGYLRRARRRPGVDRVLREDGSGLRELLAVPRAGGATRRRPGRAGVK
jgi:hypothetical protein